MKKVCLCITLFAVGWLAAACSSTSKFADEPEYHQGYGDGCATGSAYNHDLPGSVTRDAQLYDSSDAYAAGWRAGFSACRPGLSDPMAL